MTKDLKKTIGKVLWVYPNSEGYGGIPNGIALLAGCLKDAGFETKCFDTTFLNSPPLTHFHRAKHGGIIPADHEDYWGGWKPELVEKTPKLLEQTVAEFKPDIIAVSIVDVCYVYAISLLEPIRKKFNIPIIAGGITATLAPEMVINNDCFDFICVGEGEAALVELANCIVHKTDYSKIPNLWVKKDGKIIKNDLRVFKNLDDISFQNWDIFDKKHVYKPYMGTFRKTGFFELSRGCHFNCSFCCTGNLRKSYKGLGKYMRLRSIDSAFDEICYIRDKYNLELIFFIDDDFLGMTTQRFDYFCDQYYKRIALPFYIQTRSETVNEPYIKKLKDIKISTIGIGVESGDEEYRKKHLGRGMTNKNIQNAFDIINKYEIRTTANVIIGMPGESEEKFISTIKFIKELKPKSVSINYFQPYLGTRMRAMAVKAGLIPEDHIITESNTSLDMPEFSRERMKFYYENFSKLIDGDLDVEHYGYATDTEKQD